MLCPNLKNMKQEIGNRKEAAMKIREEEKCFSSKLGTLHSTKVARAVGMSAGHGKS